MSTPNKKVIVDGEEVWLSRSVAVGVIVFAYDKSRKKHVLVNKRGEGCSFHAGKWNMPGGFIDYDEDVYECGAREVYEETGVIIEPNKLEFVSFDSRPLNRQIIQFHLTCLITDKTIEEIEVTSSHSEENEVAEITWLPCDSHEDIKKNASDREWTRNQIFYMTEAYNYIEKIHSWRKHYNIFRRIMDKIKSFFK